MNVCFDRGLVTIIGNEAHSRLNMELPAMRCDAGIMGSMSLTRDLKVCMDEFEFLFGAHLDNSDRL